MGKKLERVVAIASLLLVSPAFAQPTEQDQATALALFKRGRELMASGNVDDACTSFAESQRLDPGGGTLLNLAVCHEAQGRTATAWAEYAQALALARRDQRSDRIELATTRAAALEARLSRLTVALGDAPRGLRITVDGNDLPPPALDIAVPVDPGRHTVEAFSDRRSVYRSEVEVGPDADAKRVIVEVPTEVATPVSPPARPRISTPAPAGPAPRAPWIVAGGGVVALATGGFFGVRALQEKSDSDAQCPGGRCTREAVHANDRAKGFADAATVTIAIGAATVAVALVLWVISTPAKRDRALLRFVERTW